MARNDFLLANFSPASGSFATSASPVIGLARVLALHHSNGLKAWKLRLPHATATSALGRSNADDPNFAAASGKVWTPDHLVCNKPSAQEGMCLNSPSEVARHQSHTRSTCTPARVWSSMVTVTVFDVMTNVSHFVGPIPGSLFPRLGWRRCCLQERTHQLP